MAAGATRFAGISPLGARLVLIVLAAITALLLVLSMPMEGMDTSGPGKQGVAPTGTLAPDTLAPAN